MCISLFRQFHESNQKYGEDFQLITSTVNFLALKFHMLGSWVANFNRKNLLISPKVNLSLSVRVCYFNLIDCVANHGPDDVYSEVIASDGLTDWSALWCLVILLIIIWSKLNFIHFIFRNDALFIIIIIIFQSNINIINDLFQWIHIEH